MAWSAAQATAAAQRALLAFRHLPLLLLPADILPAQPVKDTPAANPSQDLHHILTQQLKQLPQHHRSAASLLLKPYCS
jgi:hypothetical protein